MNILNYKITLGFSASILIGFILQQSIGLNTSIDMTNPQPWQFLLYAINHLNLIHLLLTLPIVVIFSSVVEKRFGSIHCLIAIVLSVMIGGTAHYIFGELNLMGASGAAYGLMVASIATRENPKSDALTYIVIGAIIIELLGLTFNWTAPYLNNVSHLAHIGGSIGGAYCWFNQSDR